MPLAAQPLRKLGFLTIGLFDPTDPAVGHEYTLQVIELGERLGFDSAWLRHRHLQFGISSPIAVMAAASQCTSRIELGTAVTPSQGNRSGSFPASKVSWRNSPIASSRTLPGCVTDFGMGRHHYADKPGSRKALW